MNTLKTFLLMGVLTVALVLLGGYFGGEGGALTALVLAGAMNFVSYFFSDKIVLKMNRARVVGRGEAPVLYEVVESLARRAGMPMPKASLRAWYACSPTAGSTLSRRIFSGARAATSSISTPPSAEAISAGRPVARSTTMPR